MIPKRGIKAKLREAKLNYVSQTIDKQVSTTARAKKTHFGRINLLRTFLVMHDEFERVFSCYTF